MKIVLRFLLWSLLLLLLIVAGFCIYNYDTIRRVFLGGVKVYETVPPALPKDIKRPAVLVFSKTNAFRHEEAIPAANALLADLAKERGWGEYQTENAATFTPDILSRFDAVVFNNVTGDIFTPAQRSAFEGFIENGGGFVALHAAGDSSHEDWPWYGEKLIGAKFIGHPLNPQFQRATVRIEDRSHPATANLPSSLKLTDEWYSFDKSPRQSGYRILATLDERSYSPKLFFKDIGMGADHPIAWAHCVGKGRVLYNAMGHEAEIYAAPAYRQMLTGAVEWAMRLQGKGCGTLAAAP